MGPQRIEALIEKKLEAWELDEVRAAREHKREHESTGQREHKRAQ